MSSHTNKNGELNRRDFFKKAAAIGLGASVAGTSVWRPRQALAGITLPREPVPRRPFGRSGIMVSSLSLGGMFDILNNRLMLAKALDWGINYWDTAEGYGGGRSEEGIGHWFVRNPNTREQVFLVTKLSARRGTDFTPRPEESLKRLHTDYVDLFMVHGIRGLDEMEADLASWSRAMKKAGKIRLFGFSTHSNMEACLVGPIRPGTRSDYCAGCGRRCSEVLAKSVPISDVMRSLMYLHSYQDLGLARTTFKTLPAETGELLTQLDFSAAERSCPRNLPIGRLMREAAILLT